MGKKITIDLDEIKREYECYILDNIEKSIGREISEDSYKRMLLYCLGYVNYSQDILSILDSLDLTDEFSDEERLRIKESEKEWD